MQTPDLSKLRRFALVVAAILITLVLAQVELETPVRMAPFGIPLVVRRPDLLTIALVIAAVYATLRYIYYGILAQPSPMRTRRILLSGKSVHTPSFGLKLDEFIVQVQKEVDRYFPSFGNQKVENLQVEQSGSHCSVKFSVPIAIRVVCWIENFDFLLPIIANLAAVALWAYDQTTGS